MTCGDYLALRHKLSQHIVWLDPPWGGPRYSSVKEANASMLTPSLDDLNLGATPVSSLVGELLSPVIAQPDLLGHKGSLPKTRMVALRLPSKINLDAFFQSVSSHFRTCSSKANALPDASNKMFPWALVAVVCRFGRSYLFVSAVVPFASLETFKVGFKAVLKSQVKVPYRLLFASSC